jgi:tetratricopeptide (TPR) repeat protein
MNAFVRHLSRSLVLTVALAVGAASFSTGLLAADAKAPSVSKAVVKPLSDAQKAIQEKKFDEALATLNEVEANTKKTPYDTFVMHQLRAYALSQLGRQDDAIPSYVAQVESGFLAPEDADRISRALVAVNFQKKDYPKTIELGQKVIASGKAVDDIWYMVAASDYFLDKPADATRVLNDYYADVAKRGAKPTDAMVTLQLQIAAKSKDTRGMAAALEKMVEFYPKPERWHDLLVTLRDTNGRGADSEEYALNIYRLMRETSSLKDGQEIVEMASLAIKRGSPGEATDALKRGTEAGLLNGDGNKSAAKELQQSAAVAEKADRASLGKFETEAKAAKTGESDVRLGQAFLSYDQADKAVEALQRGIAKGSLRNADEAQILLGIAYLKLGRKPDAATAFAAAKSSDAKFGELARLWGIVAKT